MRSQLFLFCFMNKIAKEECSELWKKNHFWCFSLLGSFTPSFWAWKWLAYSKIPWNDKIATCRCVPNYFYFVWWSRLAGRSAETYENWLFFSIFNHLGAFPLIFGQVKDCLMLELHKIIRVSHEFRVKFFLFCLQGWVYKVMKNNEFFFCFWLFGSFSPRFWAG